MDSFRNKKNLIWIVIFASIVLICLLLYAFLGRTGGTVAVISVDGEEQYRIDLTKVKEPYDIELRTEFGYNRIRVEQGAICVAEADCPDLICVNQGKLTGGGIPVICMPHRLVIQIEGGDIDG